MVHTAIFENIDEKMIKIAPVKAKGRSVPFVLAADGWKRMLVSKSYSSSNIDWRTAFANDIKKI